MVIPSIAAFVIMQVKNDIDGQQKRHGQLMQGKNLS